MVIPFIKLWWKPLAGGLIVLALLLLYRYHVGTIRKEAIAECNARHEAVAATQRGKDQKRADTADSAIAGSQAGISTVERHYIDKVRTIYRDRPSRCTIDADGVRIIREADAAAGSPTPGVRTDAVRAADTGG